MKLSIITINYNNAEGLRKTMESVFSQTYRDFEYIVVDGASTDGSVDIIKDYSRRLEIGDFNLGNFKWVSEPDTGIYNAMNKGIEIALGRRVVDAFNRSTLCGDKNKGNNRSELVEDKNKGREDGYVLMLNSGDFLVDEHVLERILPELHDEDIIQGNLIEEIGMECVRNRGYGRLNISFIEALGGYILHQAAFIKMAVYEQYGYYDESYKKNADTYFFIKTLALGNASFRYIDIDIANFDMNGISNNPKWVQIGKQEDDRWYNEHISKRMMELYNTVPAKIKLYDTLHSHKFIWSITKILVRIVRWITPEEPSIKKEKI